MITLVRHAKSTANGEAAIARGNPMAELSEEGLRQCPDLRDRIAILAGERALSSITVNVSELWRTQQTAQEVGFEVFRCMPILNESTEAAPLRVLLPRMQAGWLPHDTLKRAEVFLGNPELQAKFNFSHGLFIASCRYVAGDRPKDGNTLRLVPFYAQAVEIPS